jgi:hypothetical protein
VKHFASLTQAELDALVSASIKNGEVWSASQCSAEYLPELIRVNRARIDPVALKALEYQIANNERYRPEVSQG